MAEKMDSDRSISGESSSTSSDSSSSGSTDGDDEALETVRILGHTFELPPDLCEDYSLFKEVFSMKTWESLEEKDKEHLKTFLPEFKENDAEEKETTLKMLFDYEPFKFTSPLSDFYNDLKLGNYRPDLAKMRKLLAKARRKQQRQRMRDYYAKLLPSILLSRERLLAAVKGAPPGPIPFLPHLPPKPTLRSGHRSLYHRAKQRYFDELNAVKSEVGGTSSDDEMYPEGPDENFMDKQAASPGSIEPEEQASIYGTLSGSSQSNPEPVLDVKEMLIAHKLRRMQREVHPELNTNGITLEDVEQRINFGAKKMMFGGLQSESPVPKMKRGPKKDSVSKGKVSEGKTIKKIKEENDVDDKTMNIKYENESDSESSSFVDPVASPKTSTSMDQVEIKQEVIDDAENNSCPSTSLENYNSQLETEIKEEPPDVSASGSGKVHLPIKLEDLDGIDMMALPVQLADEVGEVIQVEASADVLQEERVVEVDESLTETTHANFLSMVRALFPARDAHRASKQQLHARCGAVMKSPIAPLNTWYPLSDDWCAELDSALEFLAGERGTHPDDFVPYLQYMPKTQIYQWIGAGRDCDSILDRLCDRWLRAMSPRLCARNPPPPKYPTSWTVRPPTGSDISEFRVQERRRFTTASKPFTYIQHGYRSVVGPCARAWVSSGCAGTSLLVPDRPRHATFTSLVRDALARLPNGEGTRHDVMTLLKMSQYIAQSSEQALLGAVSAVLERFHSAKRDPVVKFDQRTAIWMYLHRNRTEDDWMKTAAGRSRNAKATAAISPTALPPPSSPPPAPIPRPPIAAKPTTIARAGQKPSVISPPPLAKSTTPTREVNASENMEVDDTFEEEMIEASDSDVDVDDTSVPTSAPQLSSAQLLMQATLGQANLIPPAKSNKPSYTPPPKRAYTPKQTSFTKQNKQAVLMSQSVKQAKILAEAVKQASATAQNKANLAAARSIAKQAALISKASTSETLQSMLQSKIMLKNVPKTVKLPTQSPKAGQSPRQPMASPMQPLLSPMHPPPSPKQMPPSPKPPPSPKQSSSPRPESPIQPPSPRLLQSANKPAASAKQPSISGKLLESPKLPSPKQPPISEKQFPPVYLSKEEFSLSGTELPHSTLQPTQVEIKPQAVFLKPQSPIKHVLSPKQTQSSMPPPQSPTPPLQSPTPSSQSPMPPPQSPIPTIQSSMPPPKSTMPLAKSSMPPPKSPIHHSPIHTAKHLSQVGKQVTKTGKQLPYIIKHSASPKSSILSKSVVSQPSTIKTIPPQQVSIPMSSQASATLSRSASLPTIVATPHKSPLIKQRTSIKTDAVQASVAKANLAQQISTPQTVIHPVVNPSAIQNQKMAPGTRSLLIRPSLQTSDTVSVVTSTTQVPGSRRGVVRVLSPANPSSGKSLISPRALLQDTSTTKKRTTMSNTTGVTTLVQSPVSGTAVVSSVQTPVSPSVPMRTVQLAGGRTLQLSANQTVHFPGGQAVQLSPGHALQLSSLQYPSLQMQHTTHSVRLPSGQTVPLATPQVMQALKASQSKNQSPRVQTTPTLKTLQSNQTVIPVSSVQLAGQTVQFGNQTVQLAGQSVQLTGHTVKLPSGQSVQVASPNVLPSSVQLAGQTFQLAGGSVQTVQMAGQSVQIPNSVLGSQTVQLTGQTVQLANSQTVQLAGSQTVQLPSGQTLQLPSGQTLQLAGGVQLANQAKALPQVVRNQGDKANNPPIMAKLLTNAQGQMMSLEGLVSGGRIVSGVRPRPQVRVLSPATRLTRPLLLTSAKPLHNIILQSDGSAVRVTSTGGVSTSQTIVISSMAAQTVTTPTTTTPVLKLQQASSSATTPTSSGVRSVVMDGQQLKLVSGRHVLARILRPNHPPPQ